MQENLPLTLTLSPIGRGCFRLAFVAIVLTSCTTELFKPIGSKLSNPVAIAVDAARNRAYVVNSNFDLEYESGSLMVLDLTSPPKPTVLGHAANPATLPSLSGQVYLDASNRLLFVTNRQSEDSRDTTDQILRLGLDESSGFLANSSAETKLNPLAVACCDASSRLYVVSAQGFLDVFDTSLGGRISIGLSGTTAAGSTVDSVAATRLVILGGQAFVTTELGLIIVVNLGEVGTGANPVDYVISGGTSYRGIATDGTLLYAVDAGSPPKLVVIDPQTLTAVSPDASTIVEKKIDDLRLAQIEVGSDPNEVVIFGGNAYVSNRGSDSVSVANLVSRTVTASVTVGDGPFGLAAATLGNDSFLFVTNLASDTISIVNLASNAVVGTYP